MPAKKATPKAKPQTQRHPLSFLDNCRRTPWLIFAVALLPRLVHLIAIADSPSVSHPIGDGESYHLWAQDLAAGHWLGTEIFYAAPLYPYFMGVIYTLFGPAPLAVLVVQALMGAFACVLVARAGARFFDERSGALAGLLMAVYPVAIYFDGLIQKTSLDFTLFAALLYLVALIHHHAQPRFWALAGVALGLLCLTRENALIFLPVLLAWLALFQREAGLANQIRAGLAFLGAFLLCIMPVTTRNLIVTDKFVLTTSNFGTNFYIGNREGANGRYEPLRWGRDDWKFEREDALTLAREQSGQDLDQSQVSAYWLGKTFDEIAAKPLAWIGLMRRKSLLVLNAIEIGDTESVYGYAEQSTLLAVLLRLFHFGILLPLALVGMWLHRADWRRHLPLYLLFASYAFSVVLFFVFDRFRFPLVPLLAVFAAPALLRLREWKPATTNLLPLALLLAGAVLANWPLLPRTEFVANSAFNHGKLLAGEGKFAEAVSAFRSALETTPNRVELKVALANALVNLGRKDEARAQLDQALQLKPDYAEALAQLGLIEYLSGREVEAVKHLGQALEGLPNDGSVRNNFAWILATTSNPALVDAPRALDLAQQACKLDGESASNLDTLAAAQARCGRFDEAVATMERAIALLPPGDSADRTDKQARLSRYRNREPYIQ